MLGVGFHPFFLMELHGRHNYVHCKVPISNHPVVAGPFKLGVKKLLVAGYS